MLEGGEAVHVPGLFESVDEDEHVIHSNPDDNKEGDNVKHSNSLDSKHHTVDEEGQREAAHNGHHPSHGGGDGKSRRYEDQDDDQHTADGCEHCIMDDSLRDLAVYQRGSSIQDVDIPTQLEMNA